MIRPGRRRGGRTVVVDDPLDAAAVAADDDRRAARQAHRRRAVVVERRVAAELVARRLLRRIRCGRRAASTVGRLTRAAGSARRARSGRSSRRSGRPTGRRRRTTSTDVLRSPRSPGLEPTGTLPGRWPRRVWARPIRRFPAARPRARAAVSAAPATILVGRTIGARYRKRRIRGAARCAQWLRTVGAVRSADDDTPCPAASRPCRRRGPSRRGRRIRPPSPDPSAEARPRRAGRPRSRSPAVARCASRSGFFRSTRPLNGSTSYRLSDPTSGRCGSAIQTASCVPRAVPAGVPVGRRPRRRSSSRGGPSPGRPGRACRRGASLGDGTVPAPSRRCTSWPSSGRSTGASAAG